METHQHTQPHFTVSTWLRGAKDELTTALVRTSALDAELILAYVLDVDRTWLHAHREDRLPTQIVHTADGLLAKRVRRVPLAYLIGYKEFYGRNFIVTPDVLIPRPESETMIDLLKELTQTRKYQDNRSKGQTLSEAPTLVDVGTGSGCLGITAKLEIPRLDVILSDVSLEALAIARKNAEKLHADVTLIQSDLLSSLEPQASSLDIILANLPYVDPSWERSPETDHEPALALFAEDHGLALIYELLLQAPQVLAPGGYVLLEADPEQHAAIISRGQRNGLVLETVRDYIVVLRR